MKLRHLSVFALLGAVACASVPDRGETVSVAKPDENDFARVHPVMMHRCGSLDCHGDGYRNMRIMGYLGRRLDPGASPVQDDAHGGVPTTPAELDATFRSVTGLEPEILSDVVRGTRPVDDLTLIRKGRYTEFHRGAAPLRDHPLADTCLTSWLAGPGKVDVKACCNEMNSTDFFHLPECCSLVTADVYESLKLGDGICPPR